MPFLIGIQNKKERFSTLISDFQCSKNDSSLFESNHSISTGLLFRGCIFGLTGNIKEVDGLKVNFGVYEVIDVNAFACGDGSVRICAGLMDIMTDDEVMAVVGHEIGHVTHTDSKDPMKNAYLRSAVKNAAGAASSTVSKLSDSELGAMAEALAGAQYSQKQETEADDYGFEFCIKNNLDPYAMYNALNKLLELSAEAPKESKFQKMFSSHPDTAKRVARAKEKADEYMKDKK